jgi:hypothetical protein
MGTRADFYIRNENSEPKMKWLGSIGYDGYPEGIDGEVLKAQTEEEYELRVDAFLKADESATHPNDGWPWPWNDSRTTDYSYIFENGKVMASNFGYPLFDPLVAPNEEDDDDDDESKMGGYFPDMSAIKNVQFGGKKSGLIVVSASSTNP